MSSYPPVHLPSRRRDAHKGSFGSVLMIGGSRGMSGSIAMSAVAALRTGAGLVTAAIPDRCLETVAAFHPAIMTLAVDETQMKLKRGRFPIRLFRNWANVFLVSRRSAVDPA